jgi:heat shock protein HslJ
MLVRPQPGIGAVVVLALSMLLIACSVTNGGGSGTATATVTPDATPTTVAEATAAPQTIGLSGTRWRLMTLGGKILDTLADITLDFQDGQAGGNAGCNDYGGAYDAGADGSFSMPDVLSTRRTCEGVMGLESAYLAGLRDAAHYRLIDDRLELADAGGETLLVFASGMRAALDGTSWTLVRSSRMRRIAETQVTIAFDDGRVTGTAGCNSYSADYATGAHGALAIGAVEVTDMVCGAPDGIMEQERAFFDDLSGITFYQIVVPDRRQQIVVRASELHLVDDATRASMVFANTDPPPGTGLLDGTRWVLTHLDGQPSDTERPVTLMVDSQQFAGETACGRYGGAIQATPDGRLPELRRPGNDGYCPVSPTPAVVSAYFAAFDAAVQYRLSNDRLELLDDHGAVVLAYRPGLPDGGGLAGTAYRLVALNGAAPLAGTNLTLTFGDLWLSGEYGCNSGGGPYMVVKPGVLSIGGMMSTNMGCNAPEGILEQETAYLDALHGIATYRLTGSRLELINATGETTLNFDRLPRRLPR